MSENSVPKPEIGKQPKHINDLNRTTGLFFVTWETGCKKYSQGPARILLLLATEHRNIVWDVVRPAVS